MKRGPSELGSIYTEASQVVLVIKNPLANAGEIRGASSVPESGRSSGEGHGNPLQSCLENPVERGAWRAIVHGVTKRHESNNDTN